MKNDLAHGDGDWTKKSGKGCSDHSKSDREEMLTYFEDFWSRQFDAFK